MIWRGGDRLGAHWLVSQIRKIHRATAGSTRRRAMHQAYGRRHGHR